MSKIEVGRYSERLRRALGMKGQEIVSGELSPEVSPVIVIEDNSVEWQFLQQVRLCSSSILQPAVAAQNTLFRYRNPAGSAVIANFSGIQVSVDGPSDFFAGYGVTIADLGTIAATALRDHRWDAGGGADTTIVVSRTNNVALNLSQSLWNVQLQANTQAFYNTPFILLPGEVLEMGTTTVNVKFRPVVDWTERRLPLLEQ